MRALDILALSSAAELVISRTDMFLCVASQQRPVRKGGTGGTTRKGKGQSVCVEGEGFTDDRFLAQDAELDVFDGARGDAHRPHAA